jgi:hypothetical protein
MGHFWLHYKACTLGLNQDERDLVMVEGLLGVDLNQDEHTGPVREDTCEAME